MSVFGIPAANQELQRRRQVAQDQHGRRFFYFADKKSGDACTQFSPMFQAPWYPDQYAIRVVPDQAGRVEIDYDLIIRTRREERARYDIRVIEMANRFNVPNYDPKTDKPTAQMAHELGAPPLDDTIPRAARAGNKFVLGLRPYNPDKYPADVKLADALAIELPPRRALVDAAADAEEFADEDEIELEEPTRGRKRSRQTVG